MKISIFKSDIISEFRVSWKQHYLTSFQIANASLCIIDSAVIVKICSIFCFNLTTAFQDVKKFACKLKTKFQLLIKRILPKAKNWYMSPYRSSHREVCRRKDGRPTILLKKRPWHSCFPANFAKFLRTPFLQNTSGDCLDP